MLVQGVEIVVNYGYNFKKNDGEDKMAQVPADIGCSNDICIAKDECKRRSIAKDGSAREVKEFSGNETKKCGKFLQK